MDPFVAHLVEVGHVDRALADVAERRRHARRKVDTADAEVARAEARLVDLAARHAALRKDEKARQAELARVEGLARTASEALANGYGSADAAQRQIARSRELADAAETAILELMEQREGVEADQAETTTRLATLRDAAALAHADHDPVLAACDAEQASLSAARDAAIGRMPRELRGTYDRLMKARGVAVALLVDGTCAECSRVTPLQQGTQVREGRLVTCAGCGCWLVAHAAPPTA